MASVEEQVMIDIAGIYEVAIRVRNLESAEAFYRDILGLEVGLRDEKRRWVFLRAGGLAGMVVLQETPGEWPQQHLAFTVTASALDHAVDEFGHMGVPLSAPITHEWIPARSVYFTDPDGHDLELCAPIRGVAAAT